MTEETFGDIELNAGWLTLRSDPFVRMKASRLFPGMKDDGKGALRIKATESNAEDIAWMLQRWPHRARPGVMTWIRATVAGLKAKRAAGKNVLAGHYKLDIQTALPLRDYQIQAVELTKSTPGLILGDSVGLGKEQPVSEPTPTPSGWRRFGDLRPGDLVFSPEGLPIPVLAVFPQGQKDVYRVVFSDGTSARCGIDHLWMVQNPARRKFRPVSLAEISARGLFTKSGPPRFRIPRQQATQTPEIPLPIDPYFAGIIIGDGCTSPGTKSLQVTVANTEMDIIPRLPAPMNQRASKGCVQVTWGMPVLRAVRAGGIDGYSHEKRIPPVFMCSGTEQRMAIFRGLMDSDGSCRRNRSVFHTTNQLLAEDVKRLADSLGCYATVRSYERSDGKPDDYQVRIQADFCPFLTERKVREWRVGGYNKRHRRAIIAVEKVGVEESVCIKVPGGLYLTNSHIVTHNTATGVGIILAHPLPALVVCPTHIQKQWCDQIRKFAPQLKCHIIQKNGDYPLPQHDVTVITYAKLPSWAQRRAWHTVIYDEGHELRGEDTEKGRAAIFIAEVAKVRVILTATAVFNYAGQLFNMYRAVAPGALGTREEFSREWKCDHKGRVTDPVALGQWLRSQFLYLRRTREEVGRELPAEEIIHHIVEHDPKIMDTMKALGRQLAAKVLEGTFTEKGIAARELDARLRQVTGLAKAPAVADFVIELAQNNEPVLLAGWHLEVYAVWRAKFEEAGVRYAMYTGAQSAEKKALAAAKFINREVDVLIISLRAGEGLDGLQTVCKTVVIGEPDWSPARHKQLIGRARRDGMDMDSRVTAFFLMSETGSDPIMAQVLGAKWKSATAVTDPDKLNPEEDFTQAEEESRVAMLARDYLSRTR